MGLYISNGDRPGFAILDFQRDLGPEDLAITLQSKLLKFGEYLANGEWSAKPHFFKAERLTGRDPGVYSIGPEIVNQGGLAFDLIAVSVHGVNTVEEVTWPELQGDPNAGPVQTATTAPPEPAQAQESRPGNGQESAGDFIPPPEPELRESESLAGAVPVGCEAKEGTDPPEEAKPSQADDLGLVDSQLPGEPAVEGRDLDVSTSANPSQDLTPPELRAPNGSVKPEPVFVLKLLPEPAAGHRAGTRYGLAAAAAFTAVLLLFLAWLFCVPLPLAGSRCQSGGMDHAGRDAQVAAQARECIASKVSPPCGADKCIITYLNDFPSGDFRGELIEFAIQTSEQCRISERDTARRYAEEQDRLSRAREAEEKAQREAVARERAETAEKARLEAEEHEKAEAAARERAILAAEDRERVLAREKAIREAAEREEAGTLARERAARDAEERERAEIAAREIARREAQERERAETAAIEQAKREAAKREEAEAREKASLEAKEHEQAIRVVQEAAALTQNRPQNAALAVPEGNYSGRTVKEDSCSPFARSVIVTIKDGRVCWEHDLNFSNQWAGTIDPLGVIDARVLGRPGTSASGQLVNGGAMSIDMTYPECASRIRIKLVGMIGTATPCP
jgi:hypothetical protein